MIPVTQQFRKRNTSGHVDRELDRRPTTTRMPPHTASADRRHTYATALVNAGVSLQALMALLGHLSAEMSLRYGRLFDATVRTEYERALTLAKQQARTLPTGRIPLPLADITGGADWKTTPLIKTKLVRRVLPARTRPGRLHLRQHLRALPKLPRRAQFAAHPGRPARRRPSPRPRRREARLDRRSRTAPQAHRPTRHPDQRGPNRMTTTSALNRVERACAQLHHDGRPVTFTAVAAITGLGRTTLYRNPTLRAVIDEHRHRTTTGGTLNGLTDEIATLRAAVDAIAARVRRHEEQLRRLTTRTR